MPKASIGFNRIFVVKRRGEAAGYRVYIGGAYHSYHKTKACAKAALGSANKLESIPQPTAKAKALAKAVTEQACGSASRLGSTPRPTGNATRLKRKAAELGSTPRPQAVLFKGLRARFSKIKDRWTYRAFAGRQPGTDNKIYLGTSHDQKLLASKIAEAKGVGRVKTLRKKCDRRSVDDAMHRFKILASCMKGWVPRDLTGAISRRGQAASMIVQAPGVYVAYLYGREHSWRDAVLNAWATADADMRLRIAGLDSNDENMQREASKIMHTILRQAFVEWATETKSDKDQRLEWKLHVDRNVGYHLSLTAWGLREKLLKKTSRAMGSLGVKNQQGEWYGIRQYAKRYHLSKMLQLHRLGRMLLQTKVPHTNKEWLESIEGFGKRCSEAGINSGQKDDNYQFWWLCRIYLIIEMRHKGIERLRVTTDWDKDEVAAAVVPDMNEWLSTWMASKDIRSLKVLLSRLAFREPLELLSCFCCILGDNDIERYTTDELESSRYAIGKQRQEMIATSATQDEANPAIIIRRAIDGDGSVA